MTTLQQLFDDIENDQRWFRLAPTSIANVEAVESRLDKPLPEVVAGLYRILGGGEWAGERLVQFFDLSALTDVNLQLAEWLPGTCAFAADGGSLWYLVDSENVLGKGKDMVWSLPAGAPFASEARFVAENLPAFIEWMIGINVKD